MERNEIEIEYEPKKDLKNWLRIKKKYPENFRITKEYPFDRKIDLTEDNFERIIHTISKEKIEIFKNQASLIQEAWEKEKKTAITKITEYLKMAPLNLDLKVNLTTAYLMPFDHHDNWLMIPTHKNLNEQMKCLLHELFHIYQLKKNPNITREKREKEAKDFLESRYY